MSYPESFFGVMSSFRGFFTLFQGACSPRILLILIAALQTACVSNPLRLQDREIPDISTETVKIDTPQQEVVVKDELTSDADVPIEQIPLQAGTGRYIGSAEGVEQSRQSDEQQGINLNFKNMDLQAFVQAVLGEALGQNFVIDPDVAGKVTIQTVKPLAKEDLMGVLQEILSLNGAAMSFNKGRYRILSLSKAAQMPLVPRVKRLQNQGYGLQIVPLKYIGAREMAKILTPTMKNNGIVYTDVRRNLLILSGSEVILSTMIDMVAIFDVDWLAGKAIQLFPLRHVNASDLVQELEQALEGKGGELFDGIVRLIPIKRSNGILVVSHNQHYMEQLANWIKRLDTGNETADKRLYVYHLKNSKATEIAKILNTVFDDKSGQANSAIPNATVQPNQERVVLDSGAGGDLLPPQARSIANTGGVNITGQSTARIIADEVNNALVIMGTASEYDMVVSAIQQLDVLPKQVLIEAGIFEGTLTGDLSLGVEWFFKNGGVGRGKTGRGSLSLGSDGITAVAPGFSYSIIDSGQQVRMVLNALESETNVRVLSSPSVMVLDNKTAEINVGDEIPIPVRQANSNIDPDAPTVNEIQYRNTGILLSVSPRINTGGLVTLEVKQEESNAITTSSSGIDAPTIQQRTLESTVAIQSGQSVILGGLIRDNREDNVSGIPFISRIPLIGGLFSTSSNRDRRTELLVILTPRVISNPSEAQAVTEEYRQKMYQPIDSVHY